MDWLSMLEEIFKVCIVPLLAVLTTYIVKYIQAKAEEISVKADNELAAKYIRMLSDTITSCVLATNQTYVDSLKEKNAFDAEAQKEAFKLTYEAVVQQLTAESQVYLEAMYGDLQEYIKKKIESEVNLYKVA